MKKEKNIAFIDGANLYNALIELHWDLDYKKFRVWLYEKYSVNKAYIFIGYMEKYKAMYQYLEKAGFELVFKEVVYDGHGKPKGNCDADLVLEVMKDYCYKNFDKAIIVSSDGDYASLVKFLNKELKLLTILSPSISKKCSILLKKTGAKIAYINDKRSILETKNEKAPDRDRTL